MLSLIHVTHGIKLRSSGLATDTLHTESSHLYFSTIFIILYIMSILYIVGGWVNSWMSVFPDISKVLATTLMLQRYRSANAPFWSSVNVSSVCRRCLLYLPTPRMFTDWRLFLYRYCTYLPPLVYLCIITMPTCSSVCNNPASVNFI